MIFSKYDNAHADIKGGKTYPNINGYVDFRETKEGVMLTVKIHGLPKSTGKCSARFFGFHIHEGNSCTVIKDDFSNVGMHYNPTNCPHPLHVGDLPPLIENNGYAYMSVLLNKFKIKDIIGRTIIIHDSPDDFTSQPSGNSGTKIACGVIK